MRILSFVVFLLLNFGALGIGGWMMGDGPMSDWYQHINKAPWTPPGWVFGAAWTSIMICYSVYMSVAWNRIKKSKIATAFGIQLVLNIAWNPLFFHFHLTNWGLLVISLLTILLWGKVFWFRAEMRGWSLLLLPYSIWLSIATSLNLFIVLYN